MPEHRIQDELRSLRSRGIVEENEWRRTGERWKCGSYILNWEFQLCNGCLYIGGHDGSPGSAGSRPTVMQKAARLARCNITASQPCLSSGVVLRETPALFPIGNRRNLIGCIHGCAQPIRCAKRVRISRKGNYIIVPVGCVSKLTKSRCFSKLLRTVLTSSRVL